MDDDLEFSVGDVLKLHPSPRLTAGFRMRVTDRVTDDAANVLVHGRQINERTGQEGRIRKVLLAGADEFTVERYGEESAARLEKRDTLTAAEVRALGRTRGSKWSNMADWYASGWIKPKTMVMCREIGGQVKPVIGGATRQVAAVRSWAGQDPGYEKWVLTEDRATRLETWLSGQNGRRAQ